MTNKIQATVQDRVGPESYRTTAKIVGVIYLAGFVVGIGGTTLNLSTLDAPDRLAGVAANSTLFAIGALLWLLAVVGDAAHGILMFPILRRHSERLAVGYLGARIMIIWRPSKRGSISTFAILAVSSLTRARSRVPSS